MTITVNNRDIDPHLVGHRGKGFGQRLAGPGVYAYSISIPVDEAIEALSGPYRKTAAELKADDPYRTPGLDPHLDMLEALRYPPFPELVADRPAIVESLMKSTLLDWLGVLFPGPPAPRFVVAGINTVALTPERILIEGFGFVPGER